MARKFCVAFNMHATRQTGIRPRAKHRVSLRITVPIKDNSLSRVIIRLFFFAEPFRVKKSSKLFSVFTIFNSDFTVEMTPKIKLKSISSDCQSNHEKYEFNQSSKYFEIRPSQPRNIENFGGGSVDCLKITEDKSSESRVQTPDTKRHSH